MTGAQACGYGSEVLTGIGGRVVFEESPDFYEHAANLGGRGEENSRRSFRMSTRRHAKSVELKVPRDRDDTFEPVIVRKRQRRLGEVDEIVLCLYARGVSTGEIAAHFDQI